MTLCKKGDRSTAWIENSRSQMPRGRELVNPQPGPGWASGPGAKYARAAVQCGIRLTPYYLAYHCGRDMQCRRANDAGRRFARMGNVEMGLA